jgi:hypothetical protein
MAKQDVTVELRYNSTWNDHTSDALVQPKITITWGSQDESQQPAPARATLRFNTWEYNPENPASALHGLIGRYTGIRITVGSSIRFVGEVASWTPRQTLGGPDTPPFRWVEVEAYDVTYRLGVGTDPLEDATARFARLNSAVGYWALNDPKGSTRARGLYGGRSLLSISGIVGVRFGEGFLAPWLPPGVVTGAAANAVQGVVLGAAAGGFAADIHYRADDPATWGSDLPALWGLAVDTNHVRFEVIVEENAGQAEVTAQIHDIASGLPVGSDAAVVADLWDGQLHHIRLAGVEAAGDDATVTVYVDGIQVASVTPDIGVATIPAVNKVGFEWNPSTNAVPVHVRGISLWGSSPPALADANAAYRGHEGEHAGDRLDRLCDEEGILFSVVAGTAADTIPLGPQYPDGLVAILREAATVDDGLLTGHRQTNGSLAYHAGRARYNQDPVLELDYAADELAPPLEPVIDGQQLRNDVTATRRDGGSARAVDQASVDAIGRIATGLPAALNILGDGMLGDQAGWYLHLGGPQGLRFPRLSVDLGAFPSLAATVDALEINDRLTVDNLPATLTPDLASLLLLGWTEVIGSHTRTFVGNMAAEAPYRIAQVAHAELAVIGSSATFRRFGVIDSTQTGISLRVEEGPDWVYEDDFDIVIGGEQMTVTGVGAASGTYPARSQVFTVTRSVNGVVKGHPNDIPMNLFHKSYIGL